MNKILIIDHDATSRSALAATLEQQGFEVLQADTYPGSGTGIGMMAEFGTLKRSTLSFGVNFRFHRRVVEANVV